MAESSHNCDSKPIYIFEIRYYHSLRVKSDNVLGNVDVPKKSQNGACAERFEIDHRFIGPFCSP